jgi:hypothetical protein
MAELWNRLSSGSYFPPPVRRVDIPKVDGGSRLLGFSWPVEFGERSLSLTRFRLFMSQSVDSAAKALGEKSAHSGTTTTIRSLTLEMFPFDLGSLGAF